jgi:hypothetical protein
MATFEKIKKPTSDSCSATSIHPGHKFSAQEIDYGKFTLNQGQGKKNQKTDVRFVISDLDSPRTQVFSSGDRPRKVHPESGTR